MSAFGLTIATAHFEENDPMDPDWIMEDESDSSEMMSSQDSCTRPPELSPYASPIKADPYAHPRPFASPVRSERRQLFTSPTKKIDFCHLPSPMKHNHNHQLQSSPFPSPLKLKPVYDYPNDSFPALEFQTPEKLQERDDEYTSPVKTGFGFGVKTTPEKLSYGCYMSPVKAPYESEAYASHRPFTYADLLPQHDDEVMQQQPGVTIHRRGRTRNDSTSSTTEEKTLFFPIPGVSLQALHDWSTTAKMESNEKPASPLKSKVKAHTGHLVDVNGTKVALFRYGTHVFAIRERCPHAGGPLHVGDIEILPDMSICVRCPWHGWKFDLMNGKARRPLGRQEATEIFPVRVAPDGSLQIGFDHFDPKILMDEF